MYRSHSGAIRAQTSEPAMYGLGGNMPSLVSRPDFIVYLVPSTDMPARIQLRRSGDVVIQLATNMARKKIKKTSMSNAALYP